jgi:hypothetical protein
MISSGRTGFLSTKSGAVNSGSRLHPTARQISPRRRAVFLNVLMARLLRSLREGRRQGGKAAIFILSPGGDADILSVTGVLDISLTNMAH